MKLFNDHESQVEEILRQYEAQWTPESSHADLAACLPTDPELRRATLPELVEVDLELRVKAGSTPRLNDYLARFPELAEDPERWERLCEIGSLLQGRFDPGPGTQRGSTTAPCGSGSDIRRVIRQRFQGGRQSRYRLIKPLGSGGLGNVWQARDDEFDRTVAIKEIKPHLSEDGESLARFLNEALLTASLEHPGIVPVYGLGMHADGRPFYAMRLIHGRTLGNEIEGFHAMATGGKPVTMQTIELHRLLRRMLDVCHAVQFAHEHGVLHRDLKPSNIMVGECGETLVVDWGLAKPYRQPGDTCSEASREGPRMPLDLPAAGTLTGAAVGSPHYMSPEQARGENEALGPASDVYSLGATIYQILVGRPPIEASTSGEVLLKLQQGDWPRPRERNPHVPSPLESICVKALSQEPSQRYRSARELAEDLERYLAGDRIAAHRETWSERLARAERRHRSLFRSALVACILISLGTGAFAWISQQHRASADLQNFRMARMVSFLVTRFRGPPSQGGKPETPITAVELLDSTVELVAKELPDDPQSQTAILNMSSEAYIRYGLHRKAHEAALASYDICVNHLPNHSVETQRTVKLLATTCSLVGEYDRAIQLLTDLEATCRREWGRTDRFTVEVVTDLATIASSRGKHRESIGILEEYREQILAMEKQNRALAMKYWIALGDAYQRDAQHLRALEIYEKVMLEFASAENDRDEVMARASASLGLCYCSLGRGAEAVNHLEAGLAKYRNTLGDDHPRTQEHAVYLANTYLLLHRVEEAIPILEDLVKAMRRLRGDNHFNTLAVRLSLGGAYRQARSPQKAMAILRDCRQRSRKHFGKAHPIYCVASKQVAQIHFDLGEVRQAIDLWNDTLAIERRAFGSQHETPLETMSILADAYLDLGRSQDALPLLEHVLAAQRQGHLTGQNVIHSAMESYGRALLDLGKFERAQETADALIASLRRHTPVDPLKVAGAMLLRGEAQIQRGNFVSGNQTVLDAIAILEGEQKKPRLTTQLVVARTLLAEVDLAMRRFHRSERCLTAAFERLKQAWDTRRSSEIGGQAVRVGHRLIRHHEACGQTEQAQACRREVEALLIEIRAGSQPGTVTAM